MAIKCIKYYNEYVQMKIIVSSIWVTIKYVYFVFIFVKIFLFLYKYVNRSVSISHFFSSQSLFCLNSFVRFQRSSFSFYVAHFFLIFAIFFFHHICFNVHHLVEQRVCYTYELSSDKLWVASAATIIYNALMYFDLSCVFYDGSSKMQM